MNKELFLCHLAFAQKHILQAIGEVQKMPMNKRINHVLSEEHLLNVFRDIENIEKSFL
jgi:hypothetical protein